MAKKKKTFVGINEEFVFSGNDIKQILPLIQPKCSAKIKATQILQNKSKYKLTFTKSSDKDKETIQILKNFYPTLNHRYLMSAVQKANSTIINIKEDEKDSKSKTKPKPPSLTKPSTLWTGKRLLKKYLKGKISKKEYNNQRDKYLYKGNSHFRFTYKSEMGIKKDIQNFTLSVKKKNKSKKNKECCLLEPSKKCTEPLKLVSTKTTRTTQKIDKKLERVSIKHTKVVTLTKCYIDSLQANIIPTSNSKEKPKAKRHLVSNNKIEHPKQVGITLPSSIPSNIKTMSLAHANHTELTPHSITNSSSL